jgi:protoporphyrinogen oxidase
MYDFIILGAGITGCSFARLLQMENLTSNFIILEKNSEAGGLCRSKNIDGRIIDTGGGHFFGTKIPEVEQFIFNHISKDKFNVHKRVSKILVNDFTIDYPIECNLWQLPIDSQIKYLMSIINGRNENCNTNFKEWIVNKLGERIAHDYMLPYNEKIWGVDIDTLDTDWLSKIPVLDLEEILFYCLSRQTGEAKVPSHSCFYYPKAGGFQCIFDAIYKYVKNNVKLNENINSCVYDGDAWLVNGKYEAKKVINTVPWTELYAPLGSPCNLKHDFNNLKYNTIEVSLYEQQYNHNWHWLYIPDKRYKHHREYYINNFSPCNKDNSMCTESNINNIGTTYSNLLFQEINKYAYPIPIKNHKQNIHNILGFYEKMNMYGLGRWGQWGCLVSDVCILESMKLIKKFKLEQQHV